jgi:hypothetical protein
MLKIFTGSGETKRQDFYSELVNRFFHFNPMSKDEKKCVKS